MKHKGNLSWLKGIRVRYTQVQQGLLLHISNARAALFNYLLCSSSRRYFRIRIEDADRKRLRYEAVSVHSSNLRWLGD